MNQKAVPAYLWIENDLRQEIAAGRLKAGDRLPAEEELCQNYSVSRMTLRKALNLLCSDGYLYRIPGKGSFITSPEDKQTKRLIQRNDYAKKVNRGVGVLIPCITFSLFPGILRAVEDVAMANGYHIMLGNYDANPEKEREYMETYVERGVSGLIVSPSYNSHENEFYGRLSELEIPLVLTDCSVRGVEADLVSTDNVKGAAMGTRYLIESGCRRIGFLSGWCSGSSSRERFAGYAEALKEAGVAVDEALVGEGDYSEEFGYRAAREMLAAGTVDGFFSANEPLAQGIIRALGELPAAERQRKMLSSFDDVDLPVDLDFTVSLIEQPRYEIGRVAAELLLERIKERRKKQRAVCRKVLIEPERVEAYVRTSVQKGDG